MYCRMRASPEAILEKLGFNKNKKKKKLDMSSERAMYAVDMDTFQPKNLEQIKQEAKGCFAIKRERMKLERQSAKFGKVRPIFPELVQEIKEEFRQKAAEKQRKEDSAFDDLPAPFRKQFAQDAISKLTGALASSHLISKGNRSRVAPTLGEQNTATSPKSKPHTAPAVSRF